MFAKELQVDGGVHKGVHQDVTGSQMESAIGNGFDIWPHPSIRC